MICTTCRRRFGRIGENYWTAKGGICPICEEHHRTTIRIISSHEPKKLG